MKYSSLEFNREAAFGFRLDIPAGSAVRFKPGDKKEYNWSRSQGKDVYMD